MFEKNIITRIVCKISQQKNLISTYIQVSKRFFNGEMYPVASENTVKNFLIIYNY